MAWLVDYGIVTLTCGQEGPGWKGLPQTLTAVISTMEALAGGGVAGLLYGEQAVNSTAAGFGPCVSEALRCSTQQTNKQTNKQTLPGLQI